MKKKIAIIGTSPIMSILARELVKKNDVTIFEKERKFGGAWSLSKYKNNFFSDKTNLIVPNRISDAKYLNSMNSYLQKRFNISIKNSKDKIFLSKTAQYQPKLFYKYNINKLLKNNFLKKIQIKKKEIKNLKIKNNKIEIGSYKFDKLFIPMYSSINKINIENKIYRPKYKKITSKHFFLITNKIKKNNNFFYKEDFNEVFDRAQIIKKEKIYAFTGRIRKKFKKKNKSFLLKNINIDYEKNLLTKIISYSNFYRNEKQKRNLTKICKKTTLIDLIDTSNFVTGYSFIKKYFNEL